MTSRVLARAMMVGLVAVAMYLTYLVWQYYELDLGARIFFTILTSALFLSNLSLLIQSVTSFGSLEIRSDSLLYSFGGYILLEEDEPVFKFNVHYCLLSWARSIALAVVMLISAMAIEGFYMITRVIISFLLNPYVPNIQYSFVEIVMVVGALLLVGGSLRLGCKGLDYILDKFSNWGIVFKTLVLGACGSLYFSFVLMTIVYLAGAPVDDFSWFQLVAIGFGVCYAFILCVGLVIAISYGVMQLVRKASERYSVLGNVWNTLCPAQEIHIIRS